MLQDIHCLYINIIFLHKEHRTRGQNYQSETDIEYKQVKISPVRFTKLLRRNRLSEEQELRGRFGLGNIEWELI